MSAADDVVAGRTMRRALHNVGERPLLLDTGGRTRSGNALAEVTARLAGALAARGLAGERIGLQYRNSFAAFEAFLAVEWLGSTRVPVDPDVPATEAQAMFDAARVQAVLTDAEHAPGLSGTLVHDDEAPLADKPWTAEPRLAPDTPLVVYPRQVAGGELFGITTSYANWQAIMSINCQLYRDGWYGTPFDNDERLLTMQQIMHGTGMVASFPFLLMGLPQVVLPKFDAHAALTAIERFGVTGTFAVPGMLTRLADALGAPRHLPLRHTLYGGAPMSLADLRHVAHIIGPSLVQLYGRFEAGWPLSVLGTDDHRAILEGDDEAGSTCGRPIPQIQIRLGPAPDHPTGYGELQTRNLMTAPDYTDPEGWCALGDLAHIDTRGYLHLAGRLDGMINTGSYHVYPRQVEEAIAADPGVLATRVKGESDPVWGQAVTAYLIPHPDSDWDTIVGRLRDTLPTKLARYKIPKQFHRCTELPPPA